MAAAGGGQGDGDEGRERDASEVVHAATMRCRPRRDNP
jgi:hypothetical protein